MSDGGRGRASIGVKVWKSSQKLSVRRSAVRSVAWLGLCVREYGNAHAHLGRCRNLCLGICDSHAFSSVIENGAEIVKSMSISAAIRLTLQCIENSLCASDWMVLPKQTRVAPS